MCGKRMMLFACCIAVCLFAFSTSPVPASGTAEIFELDTLGNLYGPVVFDHAMHMDIASCAVCHHHTTGTGLDGEDGKCTTCHRESCTTCAVACRDCHSGNPDAADRLRESLETPGFHYDTTGLKRAYHVVCLGCHREMEAASGCEDCHQKKE